MRMLVLVTVLLVGSPLFAQLHNPIALHCGTQPTVRSRACAFVVDTTNPASVVLPAASALLYQSLFHPTDWGTGASGFGYKLGTNMADRTAYIFFRRLAFASAFHIDGEYKLKTDKPFKQRVDYILTQPFEATTDHTHRKVANLPVLLGCAASAALSNVYYPDEQRTAPKTVLRTGENIGTFMGSNAAREFAPQALRLLWNKIKGKHL